MSTHIRRGGRMAVLPATSMAGALPSNAERIFVLLLRRVQWHSAAWPTEARQ